MCLFKSRPLSPILYWVAVSISVATSQDPWIIPSLSTQTTNDRVPGHWQRRLGKRGWGRPNHLQTRWFSELSSVVIWKRASAALMRDFSLDSGNPHWFRRWNEWMVEKTGPGGGLPVSTLCWGRDGGEGIDYRCSQTLSKVGKLPRATCGTSIQGKNCPSFLTQLVKGSVFLLPSND